MVTTDITLLLQIVNMVVLIFLLNGVLYKPVRRVLREREEKLAGMREDVSKFEKNAQLRQEEVDAKMAKASGKAKAALDAARSEAQQAGDEKMSAITAKADAMKDEKLAELRSQIDEVRSGLQSNMGDFANGMASKILGRGI